MIEQAVICLKPMRKTEMEAFMTSGGQDASHWPGLIATTLLRWPLLFASSKTERSTRPRLDHIIAGSFASGAGGGRDGSELVLVSWNIARGVRRREILQALGGPLAADLYVLQEVDLQTRRTGYRNVAEEFARELRMNYVFGIEFQELAQGHDGRPAFHGQALLSRFPISRARVLRFRHQLHNWGPRWMPRWTWLQPRRGGRLALVVEIQWGGQPVVIYNVHLESKASDAGRAKQIREILEDIRAHCTPDTPVIVAGDLNTREGAESPVLHALRASGFQDVLQGCKEPVYTNVRSDRRVDWILVRHLHFFDGCITKLAISDHYPLSVHLALPAAAGSGPSLDNASVSN